MGGVEEVALVAVFLASGDASFMTGGDHLNRPWIAGDSKS
jgi:hypothetical protein